MGAGRGGEGRGKILFRGERRLGLNLGKGKPLGTQVLGKGAAVMGLFGGGPGTLGLRLAGWLEANILGVQLVLDQTPSNVGLEDVVDFAGGDALDLVEGVGVGLDGAADTVLPFLQTGGLDALDNGQAVLCQGFGGLAVDAVFGEALQLVEGAVVEVEQGGARGGVGYDACEAGGSAGLEVLDLGEETEGCSHCGWSGSMSWIELGEAKCTSKSKSRSKSKRMQCDWLVDDDDDDELLLRGAR